MYEVAVIQHGRDVTSKILKCFERLPAQAVRNTICYREGKSGNFWFPLLKAHDASVAMMPVLQ